MDRQFDVIVVGAGHAGIEAVCAAARVGAKVALITFSKENIGMTSCNPSMGGIGKSHIMNEVEALDGVISEVTDRSATQKRELNESKGYAVRATRAILDRSLYKKEMLKMIDQYCQNYDLTVIEGEVIDLIVENGECRGVVTKLRNGLEERIYGKTVVITTGTFLNGLIHIGTKTKPAGRVNENASTKLAETLANLNIELGRLKTGTPPRLSKKTINYNVLQEQERSPKELFFSSKFSSINFGEMEKPNIPYIPCFITRTNEKTHEIIRNNLDKSPIFSGQIMSRGPRYCPSIDDKIVRFASRASHSIFLETEGIESDIVYPSGISTALPEDVQDQIIHSIEGLENAEIVQYGYAIEYDFINPNQLDHTLELKKIPNLFLAGQINGTTGYEEAAGQGLIAGANAALKALGKQSLILSRNNSYIGLMIDDLINFEIKEPYRMFTSRAEFRLTMRNDNADLRLTELGYQIGLVSELRYKIFSDRKTRFEKKIEELKKVYLSIAELKKFNTGGDGIKKSIFEMLAYPTINEQNFVEIHEELQNLDSDILQTIISEAKYSPYIKRQNVDVQMINDYLFFRIPDEIDYDAMQSISNEEKEKLKLNKPRDIQAASRISGVTSNAILNIILYIKKNRTVKCEN
jgi:tRNA uridine 5-carboxymethylaminomethyl modification enzyme